MTISTGRFRLAGILGALAVVSVLLVACQSETGNSTVVADDPSATPVPTVVSDPIPAQSQAQLPDPSGPPDLDTSIRSVELEDIIFDRFDGSTTRLSAASDALIERLRDAIKPVYTARYEDASGGGWLESEDTVIGYVGDSGQAFAYPIKFLNFHELVNDVIDGVPLLVTYCPLCGSGVVFDRRIDGETLLFGNTSALYNSDLVMFDHTSGSYWFQTGGEAVVGPRTGSRLAPLASSVMSWGEWQEVYPATKVLSRDQGFGARASQYLRDPFSTYADFVNGGENRFAFPVDTDLVSDALRPAEVVVAVGSDENERAYPPGRIGNRAVNDFIGSDPVVVFSLADKQVATAFSPVHEGRPLEFEFTDGSFRDRQTGSTWNLAGIATSGELEGSRLTPLPSRRAFWFSISISSPDIVVYGQ